jgi:hypothetical protein
MRRMCDLAALVPDYGTTPHDRLLIAALRCHAAGAGCDLLGFFDLVFGPRAAGPAAYALARFARTLLARARRPPRLGAIGDPPTPHERSAVLLIRALRCHDHEDAARHLVWLAPPAARGVLLASAASLAHTLSAHVPAAAAE